MALNRLLGMSVIFWNVVDMGRFNYAQHTWTVVQRVVSKFFFKDPSLLSVTVILFQCLGAYRLPAVILSRCPIIKINTKMSCLFWLSAFTFCGWEKH